MILLYDPDCERSRRLLATLPEDARAYDWADMTDCERADVLRLGHPRPADLPLVLVTVPAYMQDTPLFGADGAFLGMGRVAVPEHGETLRWPESWDAVESFRALVEDRARLRPVPAATA
jgi:hypothetical protein